MKREELIKVLRSGLFSDRPTLAEAATYMYDCINASVPIENKATVITGICAVFNTIANEIEKGE